MKPIIPFALLGALLAVGAATAATTTPVGYVTLDVPASGDTSVGQPLHRAPALATAASGIAGDVVSVSTTLIAGQFEFAGSTQPNTYYLLVSSGPLAGRTYEIDVNSTNSITVVAGATTLQAQGFTTGTTFSVIPYWTLNTLLPGGQGVGVTTADIFDPVGLVQFRNPASNGVNKPAVKSFFYYGGAEEAGPGWYDNDDIGAGLQDNAILEPSVLATIRNLQATPKSATIVGEVPSVQVTSPIRRAAVPNDNYLNVQFPIDISLAESGLSSVLTPATDIFDPIDILFVYNEAAAAFNKPASKAYFYYGGAEEAGPGWYDNDDVGAGLQDANKVLKAGRAFVIRRAAGAAGTVHAVSPLPYSTL